MINESITKKSNRIAYIDYLRSFAMLAVILMHVSILFPHIEFLNCTLGEIFECCRFAVPLFLAITGALVLNRQYNESPKEFFINKFSRLVLPFLLWICAVILLNLYFNPDYRYGFKIVELILSVFFDFGILWYFWLILGVYLVIPIINDFVLKRGMDGVKYFLVIAVMASVFYQICNIFHTYTFIDVRFFIGPILYIFLGYYLRYAEFKCSDNLMIIISLLVVIGTSILKIGFNVVPSDVGFFYGLNNHSFTQGQNIFFDSFLDVGIIEILHVSSIFLLFRYLANKTGIIKKIFFNNVLVKLITSTSRATWGMYLSHAVFLILVTPFVCTLQLTGFEGVISVILVSLLGFFLTWIVVLLLHKIPYLNEFSGYY